MFLQRAIAIIMTYYPIRETRPDEKEEVTHYWEIENKDVIVIPSLSFHPHELQGISGAVHYEGK